MAETKRAADVARESVNDVKPETHSATFNERREETAEKDRRLSSAEGLICV